MVRMTQDDLIGLLQQGLMRTSIDRNDIQKIDRILSEI